MVTLRRAAAPASSQAAGAQGGSAQARPAGDETVREFLAAGGRRGLTTDQMFPAVAG